MKGVGRPSTHLCWPTPHVSLLSKNAEPVARIFSAWFSLGFLVKDCLIVDTRYNKSRAALGLISDEQKFEESKSKLSVASIFGVSCIVLATQDLLAWAEVIPAQSGW